MNATARKRMHVFDVMVNLFFILLCLGILLPFVLVISISISSEQSLLEQGYRFIPGDISLDAYRYILKSPIILLRAYGVTALVTVIATVMSLIVTSAIAYTLSRRDYRYRGFVTVFVFFTMFFGGGLVPFYVLMTQYLHLRNSIWAMILPGMVSPYFIMVLMGFLRKLPYEIVESAKIDGAREFTIYARLILPMSTPALATLGVLISFGHWNEWFNAMLFIDNEKLLPLQLLLVRIMSNIEFLSTNAEFVNRLNGGKPIEFPSLAARMAMVILAAGPMMFVFPFFQRYFVQGITVGSLKG